jgi:hypothetical protein
MLGARLAQIAEYPLSDSNQSDIAFLRQWLARFAEIPAPYLDLVQALLSNSQTVLRLLAYSGASKSDPLTSRACESPLWWHLVAEADWRSLPEWWSKSIGEGVGQLQQGESVLSDLVTEFVDCLHIPQELRSSLAAVMEGAVVHAHLSAGAREYFAQIAKSQLGALFSQWMTAVVALGDGRHRLPKLPEVSNMASEVFDLLPSASPSQGVMPFWRPYLIAPAACAIASRTGKSSAALRRELIVVRRLDRNLFDSIFANARIYLACQ